MKRSPLPPAGDAADAPARPERLRSAVAGRFGPFDVVERTLALPSGGERTVVTIGLPDCCCVVALDADGRFVLVRQHRHGIDAPTLEPAGGVVDPGEAPEASAARELREETGYEAGRLEPLGFVHVNPPLTGARCFFFLARGAARAGAPEADERESTVPVLFDRAEVEAALADGRVTHVLAVEALRRALAALGPAVPVADRARALEARLHAVLDAMEALQRTKVLELARRLVPHLTAEDLRNPHDFPGLDDPDWHFEDGQLAGIEAVRFALRTAARDLLADGPQEEVAAGGPLRPEEPG
jgi:8-oxo-dGTP pyrophosphatase MutT (NUDIX family)